MTPLNTIKQVFAFVGLIKYIKYMWARRSYLLQPLIKIELDKLAFKWTYFEQKFFDDIKCIVPETPY